MNNLIKMTFLLLLGIHFSANAVLNGNYIDINDYQWTLDGEKLTISSVTSAVESKVIANEAACDNCTVSVGLIGVINNVSESILFKSISSKGQHTSQEVVSLINRYRATLNTVSDFHLPAGSRITGSCFFLTDDSGTSRMSGLCSSGSGVPPKPTPVSCETSINNNTIDFGSINASQFVDGGAGNAPERVNSQVRTVNVTCTNIKSSDVVKLLVSANNVNGNFIVSSNDDIGFLIKNASNVIVPNDQSSSIPFSINSNGGGSLDLTVSPISVTGKKPSSGEFSATAILKVQID